MENELVKINKLKSADDWVTWKFQIKVLMIANECMAIVDGSFPKPTPLQENVEAAQRVAYQRELKTWQKLDGTAQKLIVLHVSEQCLLHIINCESAYEMWRKLQSIYEGRTETSIHLLQQKWFSLTKESTDDLATHIARIRDISHKLQLLGENVSERMVMTKILMTLPSSLNYFSAAWESTPEKERTVDNLVARILVEEARSTMKDGDSSNAFLARKHKRNMDNEASKNKQKPGACFKCGKNGHWKRDCWSKGQSKGNRFGKDVSKHGGKNEEALVGESTCSLSQKNKNDWYLDSGASNHMTSQRNWFASYEEFHEPISINLGNAVQITALGKGKIWVLAHIGSR